MDRRIKTLLLLLLLLLLLCFVNVSSFSIKLTDSVYTTTVVLGLPIALASGISFSLSCGELEEEEKSLMKRGGAEETAMQPP